MNTLSGSRYYWLEALLGEGDRAQLDDAAHKKYYSTLLFMSRERPCGLCNAMKPFHFRPHRARREDGHVAKGHENSQTLEFSSFDLPNNRVDEYDVDLPLIPSICIGVEGVGQFSVHRLNRLVI